MNRAPKIIIDYNHKPVKFDSPRMEYRGPSPVNRYENMLVDGDMSMSLGATGGRQVHAIAPPRMGLLDGRERFMNTTSSSWEYNNGSTTNGSGQGAENMLVDGDVSGILGATGGRQVHAIAPPRMGLLDGGEGAMTTTSSSWVYSSGCTSNGNQGPNLGNHTWEPSVRKSASNAGTDLTCSTDSEEYELSKYLDVDEWNLVELNDCIDYLRLMLTF